MWDEKWHDYGILISTGLSTHENTIEAMNDEDALSRGYLKVLRIEDKYGEVVACSLTNRETDEITHSSVHMDILDYI